MTSPPSIAHAFERIAEKYGSRVFLKEKRAQSWIDLSWTEITVASRRLRAGLLKLGLKPGDRVAILAENCPQWVIVDVAVLGMGGVVVPLYPTSSVDEFEHVLSDSGARAIALRGSENLKKISALAPRLAELEALIAMDSESSPSAIGASPRPILATLESLSNSPEAGITEVDHSDVATIIYTSGTTGASKGVVLTHGNILANCEASQAALDLNDRD